MNEKLMLIPPDIGRPHKDPTCICNRCIAYDMAYNGGGCPGGCWTERRGAAANNSENN